MTIRRYLRKRSLMLWAALIVWAISGFVTEELPSWVEVLWIVAGIALLISQFWIRCTRCKTHIPSTIGVGIFQWFKPINFCPFCGVHLDEPAGP